MLDATPGPGQTFAIRNEEQYQSASAVADQHAVIQADDGATALLACHASRLLDQRPARNAKREKKSATLAPTSPTDTARVFEVADAAQFYQAIAQNYDQRNSANLITTHMEVITRIDQLRKIKPGLSVLDLGGGTGQNVATYFFNDPKIHWSYVDYCPAMINQLRQHLAGRRLYERLNVYLEDISSSDLRLPAGSYDVVLLNLILSSMSQLPDFNHIATLVAPGGRLIIADINPSYTDAHPYFRAMASDGTFVAMRMHPVQPLEMATRAKEAGLQLAEMTQIGSNVISYSFIITFTKPQRAGEGQ